MLLVLSVDCSEVSSLGTLCPAQQDKHPRLATDTAHDGIGKKAGKEHESLAEPCKRNMIV